MSVIKGDQVVPSIDTELAAIKAAIYGEQVRGSIHDALQKTHTIVRDNSFPLVDTTDVTGAAIESKALGDILGGISGRIDKLEYVPVEINNFTIDPSVVLLGTSLSSINVAVGFSDTIYRCGVIHSNSESSENILVISNVNGFNRNLTVPASTYNFDITLYVQENAHGSYTPPSFSETKRVNFYNAIYKDQAPEPTSFTDSFLTGLSSVVSGTRARTFSVTTKNGNYIWYALPTRLGTPTFKVGVLAGGFRKVASAFEHTNSAGYKENYDIWRSDNPSLGNCTVTVS